MRSWQSWPSGSHLSRALQRHRGHRSRQALTALSAGTIADVVSRLRIALATFGPDEFETLHTTCVNAGHVPVVYVYCRSMRPKDPVDAHAAATAGRVLEAIPAGMDLLLPGNPEGLAEGLAGYDLDLVVVYGFNWKLPESVLSTPRFGVINVHSSMLPKYRGPAPVLWAIRNGDAQIGLTVHRMDSRFDAGPVLARRDGIVLDEDVTPERLWERIRPALTEVLTTALEQVAAGAPGLKQEEADDSYAGFIEPEFRLVDWSRTAREIHNQVRMFAFMGRDSAPIARVNDQWLKVFRTRLEPGTGVQVQCADGPIWITESSPADPPTTE
jgi:methionyl-tRNA formyltransferase